MMKMILALTIAAGALGAAAHAGGPGARFDRFDKDGDGKVAIADLDQRHKEFVAKADKDGDGYLTKDEMEAFHEARMAEREARRFPDANNNGTVDRREFEDAARARFTELDVNGDGLISKDEMPDRRHGMRRSHEGED
jgi:Ca2+-binding EF-hand superfamily protein